MKKRLFVTLFLACILCLTGCGKEKLLTFTEVSSDIIENGFAENYEGVSSAAEATSETITVTLSNTLEHDILFWGWGQPYVLRDETWYMIQRANPVASPGPAKEPTPEQIANRTVLPGESKSRTLEFSSVYDGATLEAGEYCICVWFEIPAIQTHRADPSRVEKGCVWTYFTVEEP